MINTTQKHILKLLVIGLDGATWEVINPLLEQGKLPNLARLMKDGSHGHLKSTIPPFSPPAWASFMTGMNPGKHGIFGFVNFNPQSYSQIDSRLVTSSPLVGRTIFDILSQFDYRLAVISVPITYPAWPINGFMVSGEPCPDNPKSFVYPETFADSLNRRYAFLSTFWSEPNDVIIKGLRDMDQSRVDLAIKLILEENLDALFLVLGATDRVQHNFWRFYDKTFGSLLGLPHVTNFEDVIPETYMRADQNIGRILKHIDEDTMVVVISDHGAGPAALNLFHTNAWLQTQRYLQIIHRQDRIVDISRSVVMMIRGSMNTPLGNKVRRLIPARFVRQGRAVVRNIAQIDWSQTLAYRFPMYPPNEGIVINLAGRQPQGVVQPGVEYESLRKEIIKKVLKLKDTNTGEQIVLRAHLREQLYNGSFIERAPDIILVLQEDYTGGTGLHEPLVSTINFATLNKVNGEHRMQGILLVLGPMIKNNHTIEGASLVDIAPTILYSLGLPAENEMDGTVLKELFKQAFLKANSETRMNIINTGRHKESEMNLTPEEEEQIQKQLERLGYL